MPRKVGKTMKLDVGCGVRPKGDVNVDLFLESNIHRAEALKTKNIPNFVCVDCHFLPFKDGCFDSVVTVHLLEHKGVRLVDACKELLRVSKTKVVIRVPNMFRRSKFSVAHDKIFSVRAFDILFKNFDTKINYRGYDWSNFYFPNRFVRSLFRRKKLKGIPNPFHLFPCIIPTELEVEVYVSGRASMPHKS